MRQRLLVGILLALAAAGRSTQVHSAPGEGPSTEVRLRLRIDETGDHVLGDRIPLIWEFTNLSTNALGFLWEGCCRINGRLTATAPGLKTEVVPPGQALAHAFAKAERLPPGVPRAFDTALGDWVQLNTSGTYRLDGTYTGVQPTQKPQVPRGLALWTSASQSEPVSMHVWTVADYLSQRAEREKAAGIKLSLIGPGRIDPVTKQVFGLRISNTRTNSLRLPREQLFALWLVRNDGMRCSAPGSNLSANDAELVLNAGESKELNFEIGPETFEGEAFGDFTLFVDVRHVGDEGQRVPSNPLKVHWSLGRTEIENLLTVASSGVRTGARNAPLKLLRTYLTQIAPLLRDVRPNTNWNARTEGLRGELAAAAELASLARVQGRAFATLTIDDSTTPVWSDAPVKKALETQHSWPESLDRLLTLRRHAGLEISLRIAPSPATSLGRMQRIRSDLESRISNLADAPHWVVASPSMVTTNLAENGPQLTVLADSEVIEAKQVLSLARSAHGFEGDWSAAPPPLDGGTHVRIPRDLGALIANLPRSTSPILVQATADARWSEVQPWLVELHREGHSVALQLTPPPSLQPRSP